MIETQPAQRSQATTSTGREHLSALHEAYLKQLASETGMGYRRLTDLASMGAALTDRTLAYPATVQTDLRWVAGGLGLLALVAANIPFRSVLRRPHQRVVRRFSGNGRSSAVQRDGDSPSNSPGRFGQAQW